MIKSLTIGLGIALTFGLASAEPKKSPARKTPAHAPKSSGKKTAPKTETSPPDATTEGKASDGSPGAQPAATPMEGKAPESSPGAKGAAPGSMKTDEKAGTKLEKGNGGKTDVSGADEKEALTAFRQGNEFLNNGLFPQAVEKYRNALAHWDHPAIHYNLALALINLDQPLDVYDQLNKAIEYGAEPLEKDKFDHAKEYLKLVEGQLADVEVSCDKIGAKVAIDGKEVFIAPGRIKQKVRVGKHTFHADKQGYNARITAPFIGPGETFRIELKLYTLTDLTWYRRKWQNTWFPYVVLGAGAVVGLAAGGLELSAQSSYNQFNARVAACNTMAAGCPIATPGITSLRDSGNTKRLVGFVGYGVAGAAVATSAVLLWINRREAYQVSPEQLEAKTAPLAVAPIVSPDAVGALVQGHF